MKKTKNTIPYFKNLDGIRFFCFLLVFLFHSFHTTNQQVQESPIYDLVKNQTFRNGNLGVNAFFVLSGFLITFLILNEQIKVGKLDLKAFYIRRILRIWPLYFICLIIGFIAFPWIKGESFMHGTDLPSLKYYLTFTSNFDVLYNGLPDASILGVLWSVAIEEQFYLIWPILFLLFPQRKSIYPILFVLVASFIFRFTVTTYNGMEYHTLSCIGDMATGGLASYLILYSTGFKQGINRLPKLVIAGIYFVVVAFVIWKDEVCANSMLFFHIQRVIFAILVSMILLEQCFSKNSIFKLGKSKWISKLGTYTYGLYCFQFVGILFALRVGQSFGFTENLWKVLIIDTVLALVFTIFIAWISYNYYEKRFLVWKDGFSKLKISEKSIDENAL